METVTRKALGSGLEVGKAGDRGQSSFRLGRGRGG